MGTWSMAGNRGRLFAIAFSLGALVLNEVNAQDFKRQYKDAREFYQEGKYNFAMESFKPLMVYDRANPYVEYASLYYAIAAYQLNYFAVAKETLLQIKNLYPTWEQQDEVNYWLAAVYFKQGEWFQGLRMLYAMKTPRDRGNIERMKNHYLLQLYDDEVVRLLLEEFPGEVSLLKRQITRYLAKGEYDKARDLVVANGLDERDFNFPEKQQAILKDRYRVAAMFPFMMETLDPSPGMKRNQSTLDLYSGIRFAVDSLAKLSVLIDLVGYDTQRNPDVVKELMEKPEMKSLDAILGPLFPDEILPVNEFAKQHELPVVNPVSSSVEFNRDNPFALLFQPDFAAIGIRAAEVLKAKALPKPCVLIVGEAKKDSVMAVAFAKRAQELGIKIAVTRYVTKATSTDVYTTLADPIKYDRFRNPIEFKIRRDSISSVFVASDDELIFTKVISSVERRGDRVLIIGHDSWIDKPSMDLDKFERLQITMASPAFADVQQPEYAQFRKRYATQTGVVPNYITRIGFECMMFVGQSLKQWGNRQIEELTKGGRVPGSFGRQYIMSDTRCNKTVPFVVFEDGVLRMLPE